MKHLRNGAEVLDYQTDADGYIVLAKTTTDFVTWLVDRELNAFHGHYFVTKEAARNDFLSRVKGGKRK